jgi:hypothetical protein
MDSCDDEKQIEATTTAEIIPVLGKPNSPSAERISSVFTIAAAAAGLISDGCESRRTTSSQCCVETDNSPNN